MIIILKDLSTTARQYYDEQKKYIVLGTYRNTPCLLEYEQ
jgi:hypothetical protein